MSRRPHLILIPGMLCDRELFEAQVQSLSDRVHCHVAEDHLRHSSIDRVAEAVVARAPERFWLAGLSMGGYVAMEICRRHGDRIHGLALLDSSGRLDSGRVRAGREQGIELARSGHYSQVLETLADRAMHAPSPALRARVIVMGQRIGPAAFVRQQQASLGRRDPRDTLRGFKGPALVLCGARDRLLPPELSREIATLIPGAAYHEIPNCGHLSPMERPEVVSERLRMWISGEAGAASPTA